MKEFKWLIGAITLQNDNMSGEESLKQGFKLRIETVSQRSCNMHEEEKHESTD